MGAAPAHSPQQRVRLRFQKLQPSPARGFCPRGPAGREVASQDPDLCVCRAGRDKWRPNRDLRQQGGKRKRTSQRLIQDEEVPRWVPLRLPRDITVAPKNGQIDSDGAPPEATTAEP
ncbi:uncharacterized protein LOC124507855 isoform X2 [Lynx rufus]|uniref:uncharacterized protein LOC124507855 isoform X2 n=1 Tax=Lynx rufus TaxID=61384 RepID=UPI001F125A3C|nr:uncharacterized protein LOC124507855 isoform X2 [Lynx rufus]